MKFHKIKVESIDRLTPKSVQINFEIPNELKSEYSFKAGQYVTIEFDGVRRDYSYVRVLWTEMVNRSEGSTQWICFALFKS